MVCIQLSSLQDHAGFSLDKSFYGGISTFSRINTCIKFPGNVDSEPFEDQVSTRYFFYAEQDIIMKVLISYYEDKKKKKKEDGGLRKKKPRISLPSIRFFLFILP